MVFASAELLEAITRDQALRQVCNVATLPGIRRASFAMPDVHWGYGFPIGGVAATDVADGGVVSPGGVGFDISCGVRLLATPLTADDLTDHVHRRLMDELARRVPHGLGSGAVWKLPGERQLREILARGAAAAVEAGLGEPEDLELCEDYGAMSGADPDAVSDRALERGLLQVGSLGSGNHFLELQVVDSVLLPEVAEVFGLFEGRVCVMIHCGSRGLGHQICSDHVRLMLRALDSHGISIPDEQLACAPVRSPEGERYMAAMAAAANYARANRQALTHATRQAFAAACGTDDLKLVYDVSHNLAKLERHQVDGAGRLLCVHRKGATRALPPGHSDLPERYRATGQPVLVPGSMGTASWVLVGTEGSDTFWSTAHGAGRTMSRNSARKATSGRRLASELEARGILVRASSMRGLAEEAPFAYKDVDEVVEVCEQAGLSKRVARLRPVGVVKG
ncbi:MAG: RNA-splicing ligase RtcB [Acidimicrobiales bacterium]|nr:MAG: RNA-splicing ligase RtcB [Acidimicrobiales bacterium]